MTLAHSLEGYLSELVTTAQNCGAWPEMRELQSQCEDGFRDTLKRFGSSCFDRGYKAARARFDHGAEAEARNKQ